MTLSIDETMNMIPAKTTHPAPLSEGTAIQYSGVGAGARVSVCIPLVTVDI